MMSDLDYIARLFCCLGIDISEFPWKGTLKKYKFIHILCKTCFPLLLHVNGVWTFYKRPKEWSVKNLVRYNEFLDLLMITLPCCLWWTTYCARNSIQTITRKMRIFREKNIRIKNSLKLIINFGVIYWFLFLFLQAFTASCKIHYIELFLNSSYKLQNSYTLSYVVLNNSHARVGYFTFRAGNFSDELPLFMQELLFLFLFSTLFYSLCHNIVQFFKHYQTQFDSQLTTYDGNCMRSLLHEYLGLLKCVDLFSEVFSGPLLLFAIQILSYMSILFLDILEHPQMDLFPWLHMFLVSFSVMGLTAVLTFCAGDVPLRAVSIKKALSNLKGEKLIKGINVKDLDTIDTVLGREVAHITVYKVVSFDRSFLFKSVTTIIAHAVIYHTLTLERSTPPKT